MTAFVAAQLYSISDTQVTLYSFRFFVKGILDPRIHIFQNDRKVMLPIMQRVVMSKELQSMEPNILLFLHFSSPLGEVPFSTDSCVLDRCTWVNSV